MKLLISILLLPFMLLAEEPDAETKAKMEAFEASIKSQTGSITLHNSLAKIETPAGFKYLNHENTVKVLEQAWGNSDVGDTLGMLFPEKMSVFAEDAWGIIITYLDDGHINDSDAKSIDYRKLLAEMQNSAAEENKERKKANEPQIEIVGWAEPPTYDIATKKMFWAKEIRFEGNKKNTLNYNIRILGKEGVLVLNAVSGMDQLKMIQSHLKPVLASVSFTPGNLYADYKEGEHRTANYGLGGLVAGGLALGAASKMGLFKVLLTALLAMKKLLIVVAIAAFTFIQKFFKNRKSST